MISQSYQPYLLAVSLSSTALLTGHAQMGPPLAEGEQATSIQALYVGLAPADLDAGGDMSINRIGIDGSHKYGLGNGNSLSLSAGYQRSEFDFSKPSAFLGVAPWEEVDVLDLGFSYNYQIDRSQSLFIAPSIRFAAESGADFSDGFEWGGVFGYVKQFNPGLALGIGGGINSGMEETSGFPIIYVYWQFAEDWRVSNPFRPGPSGPAGIEIVYDPSEKWEFGLGAGYRTSRFALDDEGIAPDGFAQNDAAVIFARTTYTFNPANVLDFYLGTAVGGELTIDDSDGREVQSEDYDPSLIVAIAYSLRF